MTKRETVLRTIAISGLNKNAGKTVALNYLVKQFVAENQIIALTSIGFDGEREDHLFYHSKPAVDVFPGMIIATAARALNATNLDKRIICATGLYTPLGEVYLAEMRQSGQIELVGPSNLEGLLTIKRLLANQADIFLVDGAINRWTQIDPVLADEVVLAVGGKDTLNQIVEDFRFQYQLWQIPILPNEMRSKAREMLEKEQWGIIKNHIGEAIESFDQLLQNRDRDCFVVGKGAITPAILLQLMRCSKGLIVKGLTNLFLTPQLWQQIRKQKYPIYILDKATLRTIVINPTKAGVYSWPIEELGSKVSQIAPQIPVIDVISGLEFRGGEA